MVGLSWREPSAGSGSFFNLAVRAIDIDGAAVWLTRRHNVARIVSFSANLEHTKAQNNRRANCFDCIPKNSKQLADVEIDNCSAQIPCMAFDYEVSGVTERRGRGSA